VSGDLMADHRISHINMDTPSVYTDILNFRVHIRIRRRSSCSYRLVFLLIFFVSECALIEMCGLRSDGIRGDQMGSDEIR